LRLTFDIEEETHEVLVRYLPHGIRKYAYKALIEGFARELERDPGPILSSLLGRRIEFDIEKLVLDNTTTP
jgi:hypothetical protein